MRVAVGEIHVWLAATAAISGVAADTYEALMSPDERGRWNRFAVPEPRLQHLVARGLLRTTLSRYADVPPQDWRFESNPYGRPHVVDAGEGAGLCFNLSHTRGLVALAVSRGCEIGVDVEDMDRSLDILRLAPSVFAPEETAFLMQAAEPQRREVFFSFWTLKEAYIKARGMGLSLDLAGFAFDVTGSRPTVRFNDRCPDDPGRWWFWRQPIGSCHALAIAATGRPGEPRLFWSTRRLDEGCLGR
jgi:4'-phosphopantetheinyl transferase